jgi:hypothetical protein
MIAGAALVAMALAAAPGSAKAESCETAFAGDYAVRQMEMGGGLLLRPDGTFRYALAYGALDEQAAGRWTCDDATVYLTGDPVTPPRFSLRGAGPAPHGQLRVTLDLPPGFPRRYFSVLVERADGSREQHDFAGEDGLVLPLSAPARAVAIRPLLPVYALAGDPIAVPPGKGMTLRLTFRRQRSGQGRLRPYRAAARRRRAAAGAVRGQHPAGTARSARAVIARQRCLSRRHLPPPAAAARRRGRRRA